MSTRPVYFLDQDDDCHWFIVDASKRKEWREWANSDKGDPKNCNIPAFAKPVGGAPSIVEFHIPFVH